MKMTKVLCAALLPAFLLAGCSMFGGGKKSPGLVQYSPRVAVVGVPVSSRTAGQLIVDTVFTNPALDNLRIAVRPRTNELEVYKRVRWANTPGEMMTTAVIQSLEASRAFTAIGRSGGGLNPDYRLTLEVRQFESIYPPEGGMPEATIHVVAKYVRAGDEKQIRSQAFTASVPAASVEVASVVDAFATGLGQVAADINAWVGR